MIEMIGLVLEGGGMRGIYTAAVLDAFLEENIEFSYIVGISAGAIIGSSYVAKQKYRCKRILTELIMDKRFIGYRNLIKERSLFGMNFLFNEVPNKIEPFDYHSFYASKTIFKTGTTNVYTGNPTYFEKQEFEPKAYINTVMRASSSLPIISKKVKINKRSFLDGAVAEPIPIHQSVRDGNAFHVIVLTKHEACENLLSWFDYVLIRLSKIMYPRMKKALQTSNMKYIENLAYIKVLEKEGKAYVFRPTRALLESRYEKEPEKIKKAYEYAFNEVMLQMETFKDWLNKIN